MIGNKIKKFFQILSSHKWAVIVAVLIGIILASPQVYFYFENEDIYKGIALGGTTDEDTYLARIQEARDGYYTIANPAWAEGKDLPYLFTPLSENVISFTGQIFGLDLIKTITLSRFIFPVFVFLLIYALVNQIIRKKIVALVASTTVLLSTNLVNPKAIWDLIINHQTQTGFLLFSRVITPVNLIFFFGFLLLFWIFIEKGKLFYGIASGIVLGLSFYSYPYTWTFLFAFLGCLAILYLLKKECAKIKGIILTSGVAALVSIPYFWNLWQAMQHPLYPELSERFSIIKTHTPQIGALILILLAIFLLFFPRGNKDRYFFCLGLVLTPLIVLNQQVITGRIMIPDHYHWYYHTPLAIIFTILIVFELVKKKSFQYCLIGLILFINFFNAFVIQSSFYQNQKLEALGNQRYGSVFEWLRNNTKKDQVIAGDKNISLLIAIYTSLNSVSFEDGHYTLAGSEESVMERIFLTFRLDKIGKEEAKEYFFNNKTDISARIYGGYYRKLLGDYDLIPDEKLNFLVDKYKEFLDIPLKSVLKKYQTDYLLWDTLEHPEWNIEQYPFLKEIHRVNGFIVFRLL
jgi:hypothetical protein